MPSSRPNAIPVVIHLLRQLRPQSILDVGVGFGKWGHLFREYTDIREAELDPARYQRKHWRVRIDGIEGYAPYLTEMHRYLYNEIYVGDATALIQTVPRYDLIFLGDILEHFPREQGLQLLQDALRQANKAVLVTTPKFETEQEDLCGNELERHRSLWREQDFAGLADRQATTVDQATLLVVLRKAGVPKLQLTPPRQPPPEEIWRLRRARDRIASLLQSGERVIVVDEEQLRAGLPSGSLPFLEKDGLYWGLPPDDATAIRELERMRSEGAVKVVFIAATFWWLDHYAGFARHLRSHYRCTCEDEAVAIFDLRPEAKQAG